jgi:hypothetical protein
MKRLLVLFLLFFLFTSAYSQKVTLRGVIREQTGGNPMADVSVFLLNRDSLLVTQTLSDRKGMFSLNGISHGDYTLLVSNPGYVSSKIILSDLNRSVDLGEILMDSLAIELSEVQMIGSLIFQKIDRQIILPSQYQIKTSGNGLELLNNMMLPRIDVNLLSRSISLSGGGNVQIRINGVRAQTYEISSLRPKDILRVEYHSQPGQRFGGENPDAVINFILKRREEGGVLFLDLANAPFTRYGDNMITTRYNFSKSEVGLTYMFHYRDYRRRRHEVSESFLFPDHVLQRTVSGQESPFKNRNQNLTLFYNHQEQGKHVFNVLFRGTYDNSPLDNWFGSMTASNQNTSDLRQQTKSRSGQFAPTVDLYYQKLFSNSRILTVNVVGTYINSSYRRDYTLLDRSDTVVNILSDVAGEKYSIIAEGIYEKEIGKIKLNTGAKMFASFTENNYGGTTSAFSDMNSSDVHAFAEIQGFLHKKTGYSAGLGFSRSWFREAGRGYNFLTFRPTLHLSHAFGPKIYLLYSFSSSPVLPTLASLNDVSLKEDLYRTKMGNPDLTPYRSYGNKLNLNYVNGIVRSNVYLEFTYCDKPIMEQVYRVDDSFIFTQINQKRFTQSTGEMECAVGPFLKKVLTVQLRGGINYFNSKGQNYTHRYVNPYCQLRLIGQYKQWSVMAQLRSHQNRMWGETITYGENMQLVAAKYARGRMTIEAGMYFPFEDVFKTGSERKTEIAPQQSWIYTKESARLLILKLTCNVDYGRNYRAMRKKLNNSDSDSGIMK